MTDYQMALYYLSHLGVKQVSSEKNTNIQRDPGFEKMLTRAIMLIASKRFKSLEVSDKKIKIHYVNKTGKETYYEVLLNDL